MLLGTAAESNVGFGRHKVCFNAEYCNKPGKQASLFLLAQTFHCHLFVWVCRDLPEIQDDSDLHMRKSTT